MAPPWVGCNGFQSLIVVRLVIGAEEEVAPLPCPRGKFIQEPGLEQTILVVALFRPRIRKQHVDVEQPDTSGNFLEEITRLTAEKMQVGQSGAVALAQRLRDPLQPQVNAHTEPVGMRSGVGVEEMSVAAADFQDELGIGPRQDGGQRGAQCDQTFVPDGIEDFSGH